MGGGIWDGGVSVGVYGMGYLKGIWVGVLGWRYQDGVVGNKDTRINVGEKRKKGLVFLVDWRECILCGYVRWPETFKFLLCMIAVKVNIRYEFV